MIGKYEWLEELNRKLISDYIDEFDYDNATDEAVVKTVFSQLDNSSPTNILGKVIVLNNRYSAGLLDHKNSSAKKIAPDVVTMSKHLFSLRKRIDTFYDRKTAIGIIRDINSICEREGKNTATSFLSKYLYWNRETKWDCDNDIPIYDSKVKGMLYYYGIKEKVLLPLTQAQLKEYGDFCLAHDRFRLLCEGITGCSYQVRDIDNFLWQYAKRLFEEKGIDMSIY